MVIFHGKMLVHQRVQADSKTRSFWIVPWLTSNFFRLWYFCRIEFNQRLQLNRQTHAKTKHLKSVHNKHGFSDGNTWNHETLTQPKTEQMAASSETSSSKPYFRISARFFQQKSSGSKTHSYLWVPLQHVVVELVVDLPANRLERESEVVQKLGHTQNIPKPIFLGVTSQNIPTQKLVFTSQNQLILEIQIFPIYEQSGSF